MSFASFSINLFTKHAINFLLLFSISTLYVILKGKTRQSYNHFLAAALPHRTSDSNLKVATVNKPRC